MDTYEIKERFVPFRKSEIIDLVSEEGGFAPEEQEKFRTFCRILESIYHYQFHSKLEHLKENYYPLNPDRDTISRRSYSAEDIVRCEDELLRMFGEILNNANYEQVSEDDLAYAMKEESLFKINLFVDFEDFEKQIIFRRGSRTDKVNVKQFFFKETLREVPVYERVALVVKFRDARYFETQKRKELKFEPGSMIVKLFKNIPKADMEMLFPNTQVRMKWKDILTMLACAVGGGTAVLIKAGAGLIAMFTVLWFMTAGFVSGDGSLPRLGPAQISAMVGGMSALAAIGAFLFKQWNSYKNRKIRFMKTLGDNLYFKNLDNNAGVFHRIIDDAEEEECKEAILGYAFLLRSESGLTETELDQAVEQWFEQKYDIRMDFEVKDALHKLQKLELCNAKEGAESEIRWQAVALEEACIKLDSLWDNFYTFSAQNS
ncbi:MAG: TMEM143 family protein [Desulfococcaceae bacterium]|jgi:hypothetical protein|nr:TMEM143 family protein [Desulfococcaceae bacterium]